MGSLSEQWRARAEELNLALAPLMQAQGVTPSLVQAVKAAVLPELLLGMADMLDVLEASPEIDAKAQKTRELIQRNQKIRTAVATGDWDAVNRIIDDAIKPSS